MQTQSCVLRSSGEADAARIKVGWTCAHHAANLVCDFQVLRKAHTLIARIWLNLAARRFGLFVFAGLIAVFGLAMANVAGFFALESRAGHVGAATAMALAGFMIAVLVVLAASKSRPGPELELAHEVRNMATEALVADAQELKAAVDKVGSELRDVRASIAGLVSNPLDVAAQKLLIPAALSVMRNIRAKRPPS